MNGSFYEIRGKEKLRELRKEGQMSQAHYRSRPQGPGVLGLLHRLLIGYLARRSIPNSPHLQEPARKSIQPRYGE